MKAAIALLCLAALCAPVHAEEFTLRWKDAPASRIVGRNVEVRLTGDTVLHGRALEVTAEGLRIEAKKLRGSDGRYGKGEHLLRSAAIALVKVNRNGILGRIIGTAVFTALAAGALVSVGGTPTPGGAVALVAIPAAGYGLGWLLDRNSLTMHFVPSNAAGGP